MRWHINPAWAMSESRSDGSWQMVLGWIFRKKIYMCRIIGRIAKNAEVV
ncbi:MAG: hypothetical protein Q4C91_13965 [Eubacteriales bacterium]|nr:hypothetical protein [Eubacteriales bacterium]